MIASASKAVTRAVIPGSFIANLVIGVALKKIWSAINIMEFSRYLKLWLITLPANAKQLIDFFAYIASGSFIPTAMILNFVYKAIGLQQSKEEETNYMRLLIFILVIATTLAVLVTVLTFILRKCENTSKCH